MNAIARQSFLQRRAATVIVRTAGHELFKVRRSEASDELVLQDMPRVQFSDLSGHPSAVRAVSLWVVDWQQRPVGGILVAPLSAAGMLALVGGTLGRHRHWQALQPEEGASPEGLCLIGLVGRSCVGVGVRQALDREAADRRTRAGLWTSASAPHERALLATLGFHAAFADASTVLRYERS